MSGCLSKFTRYISADTAARCEEFDRLITNPLKEIEEKNEILRGFKRLSDENRLDEVSSRCEELERKRKGGLSDYLLQELNVTKSMCWAVRSKKIGDVFFYYLLGNEEPVGGIKILIHLIQQCHTYTNTNDWYEICAERLRFSERFKQFYIQLGDEPQHLEYLIYKHPQLLFNQYSFALIRELKTYLPHEKLHQILLNTQEESGKTCMFNAIYLNMKLYDDFYKNNFDNLCELLSVRDKSGKTALHADSDTAYYVLLTRITLNNKDKVEKLLSIEDSNNQTADGSLRKLTTSHWKKELTWLTRQVKRNKYPLYHSIGVVILYNTINRDGAWKNAKSIQQAFESVTPSYCIKLEKMGTKHEVLELITQRAAWPDISGLIVCLLSHGSIGTIDDSEKKPITLTSIEQAMCSDPLKDKPKILIIQSCQTRAGGRKRTHEEATFSNTDPAPSAVPNPSYVPRSEDFLSVQSSVSGQRSKRNVFIPYLAEQIIISSKNDTFEDLVKSVIRRMRSEKSEQIPILKATLGGQVCLKDRCLPNKHHKQLLKN